MSYGDEPTPELARYGRVSRLLLDMAEERSAVILVRDQPLAAGFVHMGIDAEVVALREFGAAGQQFDGAALPGFSLEMLWQHAVATSTWARRIAREEPVNQRVVEDAVAGHAKRFSRWGFRNLPAGSAAR